MKFAIFNCYSQGFALSASSNILSELKFTSLFSFVAWRHQCKSRDETRAHVATKITNRQLIHLNMRFQQTKFYLLNKLINQKKVTSVSSRVYSPLCFVTT